MAALVTTAGLMRPGDEWLPQESHTGFNVFGPDERDLVVGHQSTNFDRRQSIGGRDLDLPAQGKVYRRPTRKERRLPMVIDRAEVQRLRDEEAAQLVDVLPADEYDEEHVAGAISLPLKELNATTAKGLDPSRPVITYCHDYL